MSNVQFSAAGTPAQVLAAIDRAIAIQAAATPAWERLGVVGVTGASVSFGVRPDFWGPSAVDIDAPECLPAGHIMPSGQSWFFMRGW